MIANRNPRPLRGARVLAALALGLAPAWPSRAEDLTNPAKTAPPAPARASAGRMRADVTYLADDAREGRAPGTNGIEASAEYIAEQFRKAGLKPAPGLEGYFQSFELSGDRKLAAGSKLRLADKDGPALEPKPEEEFTSITTNTATIEAAPVVFAGYGITAKDAARKLDYDDYREIDAKGKVVLILRDEPQADDPDSPFDGKAKTDFATFNHKANNAKEHGAVGVLLVNDLTSQKGKDDLVRDGRAGRQALPVAMLGRAFAERLLADAGLPTLKALEEQIGGDLKPRSRPLEDWTVDAALTLEQKPIKTRNVVGVLEGEGPSADETIVVGAHYDHLGRGGLGSLAFGSSEIHNGADDNASGTAMVMEMARRLAGRGIDPLPRRIVFIAFSGEERGLLGSRHYVNHPLYPLKQTVAMVNFDMVGRLNDRRELIIYGAGSSPGLDALVESLGRSQGLKIKIIAGTGGEFGASDHASFYRKDIPVVFAFTGDHPNYHRPSDDTDLINFDGMARIADVGELLLLDLDRRPERPAFARLPSSNNRRTLGSGGSSAYLGTQPAYGADVKSGVQLDGVTEGSPADKAGIKAGDVIVRFAGRAIKDIDDYMAGLTGQKPGDEVEVVVLREGKEVTLKATLGTRPASNPRQ
jgi:hypothetical protein